MFLYAKPSLVIFDLSRRFRPSRIRGFFIRVLSFLQSGFLNSSHSVRIIMASALLAASYLFLWKVKLKGSISFCATFVAWGS